ncbi:MAG: hypothetical protein PUE47_08900 [Lachnospiraceae bacterium]|nr:hypothetical protein [Lachnospiraceae bacterium]
MINPQLKMLAEKFGELVDDVFQNAGADAHDGQVAKFELAQFMMYLSASDGKIEWSEVNNISQYLGLNLTPEAVNQLIREGNIYSTEFEQKVPLSFQAVVNADNVLWDNGERETCTADMLLNLYKAVGEELIKADNDVDNNEQQDFNIYITMLDNYINDNDKYKKNGCVYTGIKKGTGSSGIDIPLKSGVSAPRKR